LSGIADVNMLTMAIADVEILEVESLRDIG